MFNFFPYTNFHRLNADWILRQIKEWETRMEGYAETVTAAVSNLMSVVKTVPQAFTEPEKAQARDNIGAASQADLAPLAPIPGQVQALTGTVNTHSNQILGLQTNVDTLNSRVSTNSSNIDTLISQTASHGSQISTLQSSVFQLRTDVDAIVQPVMVTLTRENNAYTLSESVADIVALIAQGERPVIINAQGVGSYPGNPYPSTAEVQITNLKTATLGGADAIEGTVTLSIGTAQELKMTVTAGASNPDSVNVSFLEIPIGGGSVEPVTVQLSMSASGVDGTWTGATWANLISAFGHGCAFARILYQTLAICEYNSNPENEYAKTCVSIELGSHGTPSVLSQILLNPEGTFTVLIA